jgi:uncharacterized protein
MKIEKLKKFLVQYQKKLKAEFHVAALYVFGSTSRGQASKKSDIDIIVEFSNPDVGLFELVGLKDFLEEVLGARVDLVTRDAIKKSMLAEIERESIRVA